MLYFLQGLAMGCAYVAPIGVQNLYVINSALTQNRARALLLSLIVIFFDVTLALACFFGVGVIIERYMYLRLAVILLGSAALLYIGWKLITKVPSMETKDTLDFSFSKVIWTACVVTWFNPQAIIDGTMMLGAFRASLPQNEAMLFISGVAVASLLWFTSLSLIISFFKNCITTKVLKAINIICGSVIVIYGLKLFWQAVLSFNLF